MENKSLDQYTKKEFLEMENFFSPNTKFTDIIFVPMNTLHDSGYRNMKFILVRKGEIVGVVSGWSDVAHINGIGGYGNHSNFKESLDSGKINRVAWSIDCLSKSRCIRLFCDKECVADEFIGSDFCFYPI